MYTPHRNQLGAQQLIGDLQVPKEVCQSWPNEEASFKAGQAIDI
jgi:hypothetical protein